MPGHRRKLKRYEHTNDVRYLTCSCYKQLALFDDDTIKDRFVQHLTIAQEDLGFYLYAWVLMPEHFHLLLRPASPDQTVTAILRRIKSSFAQRVLQHWREQDAETLNRISDAKGDHHFWQPGGGYDRNITEPDTLRKCVNYIHLNPVRRGLVEMPTDWAWSSARQFAGIEGGPIQMDPLPL